MTAMKQADVSLSPEERAAELKKLDAALAKFTDEMRAVLARQLDAGRGGWNDPANGPAYHNAILAAASAVPLAFAQEVHIANHAMFLWYQRIGRYMPTGPAPRGVGEGDVGVE